MGNLIFIINNLMKVSILALVAIATQDVEAVQLASRGIPYPALMQEQPSHWKKVWPEGAVDNSDGDAEILDRFNKKPKEKAAGPEEKYPWTLEDSIVASQASVK